MTFQWFAPFQEIVFFFYFLCRMGLMAWLLNTPSDGEEIKEKSRMESGAHLHIENALCKRLITTG